MTYNTNREIYETCLELRALDYLKNYSHLTPLEYLEFHANGPVMAEFIRTDGIKLVLFYFENKLIGLK